MLSIPYLLEAEAVETEPGQWLVRLAYPELPGCTAEGGVVEDALKELGAAAIEMIVSLAEQGKNPPFHESRSPHLTRFGLHMIWIVGPRRRTSGRLGEIGPANTVDLMEEAHALARRQ